MLFAFTIHIGAVLAVILNPYNNDSTMGGPEAIMLEFAEVPEAPSVEEPSQEVVLSKAQEPFEPTPAPQERAPREADISEKLVPNSVDEPDQKPVKPKKQPEKQPKKPATKKTQHSSGPQLIAKSGPKYAAPFTNRQIGNNGKKVATWQNKVQQRIARTALRMRRAYSGANAMVYVTFTFDKSGKVTTADVSRSGGNKQADQYALSVVKRASPIPAPPTDWQGALTVPVEIKQ